MSNVSVSRGPDWFIGWSSRFYEIEGFCEHLEGMYIRRFRHAKNPTAIGDGVVVLDAVADMRALRRTLGYLMQTIFRERKAHAREIAQLKAEIKRLGGVA